MWQAFKAENKIDTDDYDVYSFGDETMADELAELVIMGRKKATCSLFCMYEITDEVLPKAGDYSIIPNAKGQPVCVIQDKSISIRAYKAIDEEIAFKEGEGDLTLTYWRKAHKDFWIKELSSVDLEFHEELKVVIEEFEVVYRR